jgi:hypothetical protein
MNEMPAEKPVPDRAERGPDPGRSAAARTVQGPPAPQAAMPSAPVGVGRQVELAIDDLVLHGFSRHERDRIASALHAELERLVGERVAAGGFSNELEIPRVDGGAFTARRGMRPEAIGAEVARAIMRGLA